MLEDVVRANDGFTSRIREHADTMILGPDLVVVSSTMDNTQTTAYANCMSVISTAARSACRDLDPSNDMLYLRVGTRKNEVIVGLDDEFMLIAVQQNVKL